VYCVGHREDGVGLGCRAQGIGRREKERWKTVNETS
jgi:hypothetical protein